MRIDPTSFRTQGLALLMLTGLPVMAQEPDATVSITPLDITPTVIYALVALAVIQVIFIISLSSIMRTLAGPGSWMKKIGQNGGRATALVPLGLLTITDVSAQAFKGEGGTMPTHHYFWVLVGLNVFLFAFLIAQLNILRGLTRAATGKDTLQSTGHEPTGPSWEQRLLARLTRQKPIAEEADILMHHEYDGIRELDNVLPPWWLWLFYGTVAWGFVYLVNVHVVNLWPKQDQEYANEMAQAQADLDAYLASQASQVDERTVKLATDAGVLSQGSAIFKQNCATCHGQLGEGTAGPNLTDPYWLHGGGIKDVFTTVKYGVSGKAMKAWKTDLKPLEIQAVSSYVLGLQGTHPPNAKAPEGDLWKQEAPADSTVAHADSARMAVLR